MSDVRLVSFLDDGGVCFWCREREAWYRVEFEGHGRVICEVCWADVKDDEPPDENREGQPEFNGAFNAW